MSAHFSQSVDDQLITLFGGAVPGTAAASIGHYYVASGGDFEARGWGVGVSRSVTDGLRASVDYTRGRVGLAAAFGGSKRSSRPSPDRCCVTATIDSTI